MVHTATSKPLHRILLSLVAQRRCLTMLAIAPLAFASCAVVAPYDRERLAKRDMVLQERPEMAAGTDHATAYREGTTGAMGTSGGGCGCN